MGSLKHVTSIFDLQQFIEDSEYCASHSEVGKRFGFIRTLLSFLVDDNKFFRLDYKVLMINLYCYLVCN